MDATGVAVGLGAGLDGPATSVGSARPVNLCPPPTAGTGAWPLALVVASFVIVAGVRTSRKIAFTRCAPWVHVNNVVPSLSFVRAALASMRCRPDVPGSFSISMLWPSSVTALMRTPGVPAGLGQTMLTHSGTALR